MTKENLDFINNNGEKVLQLNDDIFKNIYAPQMVEFYDKVEQKNNKIKLKYESKSLNMDRSITSKNIIGVSMFAGAGGLDIGAHLAGINIKYASDINEDCVKTLESNDIFDNSIKEAIDINDIDVSSIKKKLQDEDYDNIFFQKYSQMSRSQKGLAGAGEWETLKKMLPDFKGKRVLDL
ncbi:TPA: DNA cytosine methyltransferase, partial [Clostridioides difficile]|nr:DNA cytosine methyltransferase [Clostridioides difficile]